MSSDTWTIRKVLTWTTQHFEKREVDSPRLTADVLLSHVLKVSRVRLYVDLDRPLSKEELASFRALIERRISGEPTQYLTGVKEFYNRPFKVDARVLIPRPETELLVEACLRALPKDAPSRALDVCTGSGCIAISLAAERPQASVLATDLSPDACALARENAEALGVGARVTVVQGDLFAPVPPGRALPPRSSPTRPTSPRERSPACRRRCAGSRTWPWTAGRTGWTPCAASSGRPAASCCLAASLQWRWVKPRGTLSGSSSKPRGTRTRGWRRTWSGGTACAFGTQPAATGPQA